MHEWRRKFSRSTIIDKRSERKESEKGGVIQLFDETWFVQTNISRAVIYLEAIARLITFRPPVVRFGYTVCTNVPRAGLLVEKIEGGS